MADIDREDILNYFDIEDPEPDGRTYNNILKVSEGVVSLIKTIEQLEKATDLEDYENISEDISWELGILTDATEYLRDYADVHIDELINIIRDRLDKEEVEEILEKKMYDKLKGKDA